MAPSNGDKPASVFEGKGLPPELILKLTASGRTRNTYGPKLHSFIAESDMAAINVRDVWPLEFKEANVGTLYAGFLKAAKEAEIQDQIIIRKVENELFILHKERAQAVVEAEATEDK